MVNTEQAGNEKADVVPEGFKFIEEGKARIIYPSNEDADDVPAFYNPAQVFNRDLSCAVLEEFAVQYKEKSKDLINKMNLENKAENPEAEPWKFRVLEALSASGLRSCRYALECDTVDSIIANDISVSAVQEIHRNAKFNDCEKKIEVANKDAIELMALRRAPKLNVPVIDLDPYGSATPFLDSAVQAVNYGGMLMVTCTDMGVLAGNHPEACFAKYGSFPLKAHFCHEQAIRIVLYSIERAANRYGRYIEPLISLHLDFFIRVFVRVHHGKKHVKLSCTKVGNVCRDPQSHGFTHFTLGELQKTEKGSKYVPAQVPTASSIPYATSLKQGGPMWLGPLHNHNFVRSVQSRIEDCDENVWTTKVRLCGLLEACLEELNDVPLYYHMQKDFGIVLKFSLMKQQILRSAIINAGYRVSSSHATTDIIKTDAPLGVIWDILRAYVKSKTDDLNLGKVDEQHVKRKILTDVQGDTKISFELAEDKGLKAIKNAIRFPPLPANWGPKAAARMQMQEGQKLDGKKKTAEDKEEGGVRQLSKRQRIKQNKRAKRRKTEENVPADPDPALSTSMD